MTPQQINVKLQSMKGNSYQYGKEMLTVSTFKINMEDECFTMIAGKTRYNRTFKQAPEFFKHWYEVKENQTMIPVKETLDETITDLIKKEPEAKVSTELTPAVADNTNGLADELIKILKDNIEKVQKNPGYIKQAQVVDKSIGSILNVKRMQLDMYKAAKTAKTTN